MIKNTIKINHPLTVIAVFSMLTEASAAVSLPYIDSEHQKIYVWFLIVFPSLLITLFFLTLNFNNKTLYTPADLSKAQNTPEGFSQPTGPCLKQGNSFASTSTSAQLFIPACPSGSPYSLYRPHNIFLQGQRVHHVDPPPFPPPERAHATFFAKSHAWREGSDLKTLHLMDLNYLHLLSPHKGTAEEVLHIYYKATRKYKNTPPRHAVLLLLTNQHSSIPQETIRRAIDNFKHTSSINHTTIISYNTDAHRFTLLNSPRPQTNT
ncbi:hypothetical protein [Pseudomonas fragi]|uniref:hypothetical protein n=1 Tax=Pseudomonas fragi TaxID=296 RepID=UPI002954624F|nr:hypothetical protein [Pseudomonas fragi]WOL29091.1 hypothetical protein Q1A94_05640 [Pseudomonas fragi]